MACPAYSFVRPMSINRHRAGTNAATTRTATARNATSGPRMWLRTSIRVLDPHDVVEMVRRDLEDVTVFERDHPMPASDRDVVGVPRGEGDLGEHAALVFEHEEHAAGVEEDRLLLPLVVLQRELVP